MERTAAKRIALDILGRLPEGGDWPKGAIDRATDEVLKMVETDRLRNFDSWVVSANGDNWHEEDNEDASVDGDTYDIPDTWGDSGRVWTWTTVRPYPTYGTFGALPVKTTELDKTCTTGGMVETWTMVTNEDGSVTKGELVKVDKPRGLTQTGRLERTDKKYANRAEQQKAYRMRQKEAKAAKATKQDVKPKMDIEDIRAALRNVGINRMADY